MRAVLDTSVVVSAFRSRKGAGFALIQAIRLRRFVPLSTPALFLEYEAVLKRDEQRSVSGLSLRQIDDALAILSVAIEPVQVYTQWRPQLRDPHDELVLEAAINGRADALATYNVRDFRAAAARFSIRLVRPAELVSELPR